MMSPRHRWIINVKCSYLLTHINIMTHCLLKMNNWFCSKLNRIWRNAIYLGGIVSDGGSLEQSLMKGTCHGRMCFFFVKQSGFCALCTPLTQNLMETDVCQYCSVFPVVVWGLTLTDSLQTWCLFLRWFHCAYKSSLLVQKWSKWKWCCNIKHAISWNSHFCPAVCAFDIPV